MSEIVTREEEKKVKRRPFEETLHGALHEIFRIVNIPIDPDQNQKLVDSSRRLAKIIETEGKLAGITQMKRIQGVLLEAFEKVDKRLEALEAKKLEWTNDSEENSQQ